MSEQIEEDIKTCMAQEGFDYQGLPGSVLSNEIWLPDEPVPTTAGYYLTASAPESILPQQPPWRDIASELDPGSEAQYLLALFGEDINDVEGGCSGRAYRKLGPPELDEKFARAEEALRRAALEHDLYRDARVEWVSCAGFDRTEFIGEWNQDWVSGEDPDRLLDEAANLAQLDLECSELFFRPLDSFLADLWTAIVQEDHATICDVRELADRLLFADNPLLC